MIHIEKDVLPHIVAAMGNVRAGDIAQGVKEAVDLAGSLTHALTPGHLAVSLVTAVTRGQSKSSTQTPRHERSRRKSSLGDIGDRVKACTGEIPFSGRYHQEPRKLEDDYIVSDKVLGTGLNGEVKLGRDVSQLNRKVAVKSFKLSNITEHELNLLRGEVENYLKMDHPHVARLLDVYETQTHLFLVMECLEGGELFDRLDEKTQFSEDEARDALRQILLALNYLHSHGVVHRDVKMENFVYDKKDSNHLKLIDFGLSSRWDRNSDRNMSASVGTVAYLAPEVVKRDYSSQCDMWSLGVLGYTLMDGNMPFSEEEVKEGSMYNRARGCLSHWKWLHISSAGKDFIRSLLEIDPSKRLTAQQALEHTWMTTNGKCVEGDGMAGVIEALQQFRQAPTFMRCCMRMLAWCLSSEDCGDVRDYFTCLDDKQTGGIRLADLRNAMLGKPHGVDKEYEVAQVFNALDYNQDQEIHYSDFLAAMLIKHIELSEKLVAAAFRRFDVDGKGSITADNLRYILGSHVDGQDVADFVLEADSDQDGCISMAEFTDYLRGKASPLCEDGVLGADGVFAPLWSLGARALSTSNAPGLIASSLRINLDMF